MKELGLHQTASASVFRRLPVAAAVAAAIALGGAVSALHASDVLVYTSPEIRFNTGDVSATFDGLLASDDYDAVICDPATAPDPAACPPFQDPKTNVDMLAVNSEFGFVVSDFVGAAQLTFDDEFLEGYVADYLDPVLGEGILGSSAITKRYKSSSPLGTWCRGVGANDVKCSTEHYTVMEHVLSCNEVVPYFYADPDTGETLPITLPAPGEFIDPETGLPVTIQTIVPPCASLVDALVVVDPATPPNGDILGYDPDELVDLDGDGVFDVGFPNMVANENSILFDIAASADYSVTKKDDGKALYRWGSIVKRPTDLRLYKAVPLPDDWKTEEALAEPFDIVFAEQSFSHRISNNPNDQLRPEDYENEGATGRLPEYVVVGPDNPLTWVSEEEWVAARDCYEGDGDFEDGAINDTTDSGTPVTAGATYYKNYCMEQDCSELNTPWIPRISATETGGNNLYEDLDGTVPPQLFSVDLVQGYTNSWYTTINRDPFEGYERAIPGDIDPPDGLIDDEPVRTVASGPRWRLKANKFGQDIPGLDIPLIECSPTPFTADNLKYEVGSPTVTTINLLDWNSADLRDEVTITDACAEEVPVNTLLDDAGCAVRDELGNLVATSPLATSAGWVDVDLNANLVEGSCEAGKCVSVNGMPITDDYDLAIYFKGERKALMLASTVLRVGYRVTEPVDFGDDPEELEVVNEDGTISLVPTSYPTLQESDGARHKIVDALGAATIVDGSAVAAGDGANDLTLGLDADPELDGQPTVDALGDDLNGIFDDEDGIAFTSAVLPVDPNRAVQSASLLVSFSQQNGTWSYSIDSETGEAVATQTSSDPALLQGWMDFNADGDWDDEFTWDGKDKTGVIVTFTQKEHLELTYSCADGSTVVAQAVDLVAADDPVCDTDSLGGSVKLTYLVPPVVLDETTGLPTDAGSVPGLTYSRFRLDADGTVGYSTGSALAFDELPTGEVEDYQIEIGGAFDDIYGRADSGDLWVALSDGDSFSVERWGSGDFPANTHSESLVGDYNGDGLSDAMAVRTDADAEQYEVALSVGTSFDNVENWGNRPGLTDADWTYTAAGDFGGSEALLADGRTDLVQRRSDNGNLWVALATTKENQAGDLVGEFDISNWGGPFIVDEETTWYDLSVGDFTGDGRGDVIGRDQDGFWSGAVSIGNSFRNDPAGNWPPKVYENLVVGDWNGDGRDDIAAVDPDTGNWVASLSEVSDTGRLNLTDSSTWASGSLPHVSIVKVVDLNGDGMEDIVGYYSRSNRPSWVSLISTGSSFEVATQRMGSRISGTPTDLQVGNFDGDSLGDAAALINNTWYVSTYREDGQFNPAVSWTASWNSSYTDGQVGDFDGTVIAD